MSLFKLFRFGKKIRIAGYLCKEEENFLETNTYSFESQLDGLPWYYNDNSIVPKLNQSCNSVFLLRTCLHEPWTRSDSKVSRYFWIQKPFAFTKDRILMRLYAFGRSMRFFEKSLHQKFFKQLRLKQVVQTEHGGGKASHYST